MYLRIAGRTIEPEASSRSCENGNGKRSPRLALVFSGCPFRGCHRIGAFRGRAGRFLDPCKYVGRFAAIHASGEQDRGLAGTFRRRTNSGRDRMATKEETLAACFSGNADRVRSCWDRGASGENCDWPAAPLDRDRANMERTQFAFEIQRLPLGSHRFIDGVLCYLPNCCRLANRNAFSVPSAIDCGIPHGGCGSLPFGRDRRFRGWDNCCPVCC